MKKSDLVPLKDYVRTRNGNLYCFIGDKLVREDGYYVETINYNDKLIFEDGDSDWDIINVYRINRQSILGKIDNILYKNLQNIRDGEISPIWERYEKPKLSRDEYIILKNLDQKYKWIARDAQGDLCLYYENPNRVDKCWLGNNIAFHFF